MAEELNSIKIGAGFNASITKNYSPLSTVQKYTDHVVGYIIVTAILKVTHSIPDAGSIYLAAF